jgi:CspA family cold shock protein
MSIKGTIKWFNTEKGFGFIKGEDGNDYFVHHTQIKNNVALKENDVVSFESVETDKGLQAQQVDLEDYPRKVDVKGND